MHDNLLAENRRRAGRVPTRVLVALQSSLTLLRKRCRPVCVGMAWRRIVIAGAMRLWRPRLEVSREVRQFGVAVLGGVEHISLRARTPEMGNWLVITDCSNAFNSEKDGGACGHCLPALSPFVAKCYGTRPTDVFCRIRSRRSFAPAMSSRGGPWGRQFSVWRYYDLD